MLLPEIRAEFGLSLAFLATLGTQLAIITTLVGPPMGYLADRIKRVWMVRIGAVLANLSSIGAGVSSGVPQLMGSRMTAGVAKGINDPAAFPLLTDYYPAKARARVFAFLFAAGALGAVIGPTVAGRMGDAFGWRAALVTLGLLATAVSVGTFFMREPVRGGLGPGRDGRVRGSHRRASRRPFRSPRAGAPLGASAPCASSGSRRRSSTSAERA